jgi:hypothetical protein
MAIVAGDRHIAAAQCVCSWAMVCLTRYTAAHAIQQLSSSLEQSTAVELGSL